MIRRQTVVTVLVVVALVGVVPVAPSASQDPPPGSVTWWSMGDSYAAGEGIDDAGAPCARSDRAYGPLAASYLSRQRGWDVEEANVACTGAVSTAVFVLGANEEPPDVALAQVEQAKDRTGDDRADVVTVSMGGNDVGFADIITGCIPLPLNPDLSWDAVYDDERDVFSFDGCDVTEAELAARLDALFEESGATVPDVEWKGRPGPTYADRQSLPDLLADMRDDLLTDEGQLVVVGYPRVFAPDDEWPAWRGRTCNTISKTDAVMLNRVSTELDRRLRRAVDALGERATYVSRADIFDGASGGSRSLCGRPAVTWMNGLTVGPTSDLRMERSFHPNAQGHAPIARAVADEVEVAVGPRLAPPTTTTTEPDQPSETAPPITSEDTFEIGTDFSDRCTIAWPTAPTRTSDSTLIRTTCQRTPGQFTFVDVQCDDPDLGVTPSSSTVDVDGVVADVAESEYGYRSLVVVGSCEVT